MGLVWLGAVLYKLGKLRYPTASKDTKNTTTHNNQHEQAPPYPPAALVLSLHGNRLRMETNYVFVFLVCAHLRLWTR
jgi:hypothetical protein